MLRGYGAEVVITPTAVEHDSPESYYSVSSRLAEEIPGGFKPDQYSNMANPEAHYRDDRAGDLGADRRRDRRDRDLGRHRRHDQRRRPLLQGAQARGADRRRRPRGLGLHRERATSDLHPYLVEGIGKDTWPETMDLDVVDEWIRVSDRDSFLAARRLAREEGLLVGGSSGSTIAGGAPGTRARLGPDAQVLTILPDSGRSYLSKFLDDNWMLEHGFLERSAPAPTVARAAALRSARRDDAGARHDLRAPEGRRGDRRHAALLDLAAAGRARRRRRVARRRDRLAAGPRAARPRLQERGRAARGRRRRDAGRRSPTVEADASVDEIVTALTGGTNAVVVADGGKPAGVVTRSDLLEYLAHAAEDERSRSSCTWQRRRPRSARAQAHVVALRRATRRRVSPGGPARRRRRRDDPPADGGAARLDLDRRPRAPADARRARRRLRRATRSRGCSRDGRIFEYWAHEASLLPIELWPLFRAVMDERRRHWGATTARCASMPTSSSARCSRASASEGALPARATSRAGQRRRCGTGSPRRWCSSTLWTAGGSRSPAGRASSASTTCRARDPDARRSTRRRRPRTSSAARASRCSRSGARGALTEPAIASTAA